MATSTTYAILADLVLLLHTLTAGFIVFGLLLVWLGAWWHSLSIMGIVGNVGLRNS